MSSNPYGQNPNQSGNYEDYSQGYSSAPEPSYGQQPSAPYSQPSAPGYGQPNYQQPTYGQPAPDPYGQPSYGQPYTQQQYGQAPGYGQRYAGGLAPYTAVYDTNPRPSVSMVQAVKLWLKNWKNFSGRASRGEYWWVALALGLVEAVFMVAIFVLVIVAAALSDGMSAGSDAIGVAVFLLWGLMALVGLATLVPSVALGVRRLHDTNQTGWLHLLSLLGGLGSIILIVFMAQASNPVGARFDDAAQPLYGPEHL